MDIGTQIDIALGVMAFLAAQALVAAGVVIFRLMRGPAGAREVHALEGSPSDAFARHP